MYNRICKKQHKGEHAGMILQVLLTIITQSLAYFYLCFRRKKEETKRKNIVIGYLVTLCFTIIFANIARQRTTDLLQYTRLLTLYQILYCVAVVDAEIKIIPNTLLFCGGLFQTFFLLIECLKNSTAVKTVFIPSLIGGMLSIGILSCVYWLSKQAIGFGDVKLMGMIGFYSDYFCSFSVLFFALLFATIYAFYLLGCKKKSKKEPFPFAPFILFGYCLSIFLLK
jgi:prepilin signal peptidase PulO-like enzyme (type II secretory pathway)